MAEPHPIEIIARKSPAAAGLAVAFLEHSREETDRITERVLEDAERRGDEWRDYALLLEARLERIEERVCDFFEIDPLRQALGRKHFGK